VKRQRTENYSQMMSDSTDDAGCIPAALDNNAEHFVRMMHGLHRLKKERVLCDVTLIAEGFWFWLCFIPVVIWVETQNVKFLIVGHAD